MHSSQWLWLMAAGVHRLFILSPPSFPEPEPAPSELALTSGFVLWGVVKWIVLNARDFHFMASIPTHDYKLEQRLSALFRWEN